MSVTFLKLSNLYDIFQDKIPDFTFSEKKYILQIIHNIQQFLQ